METEAQPGEGAPALNARPQLSPPSPWVGGLPGIGPAWPALQLCTASRAERLGRSERPVTGR